MNRFISALVCMFFSFFICSAQSGDEKEVVLIDNFSFPSEINKALVETLRGKMIEGIQATNRVKVVDINTEGSIASEAERRKDESAMADATARESKMKTLGAHYIITGEVTSMSAVKKTDKEGKVYYDGSVHWTIKVVDSATGTLKSSKTFEHEGITGKRGDTSDEAIAATCSYAKTYMEDFVDDTFPLEGLILKVETLNKKKNKAETVYIDLGLARGISSGQKFTVYLEIDIAGELSRKEVGSLSAKDVLSAKRTLCKVTKGGEEVLKAMNGGQKLVVKSRKERTFLDAIPL